jgi:hypothetical protein
VWWIVSDEESARLAVAEMADQMSRWAWPVLEHLLDREALLSQIQAAGDLGDFKRETQPVLLKRAEAVLLWELGRKDEMTRALDDLRALQTGDEGSQGLRKFEDWILGEAG